MASDGGNHWDDGPRIELRGDPAYRQRTEEDPDAGLDGPEEYEGRRGGFGPLRFALVGLLLIGFGGLVFYAYSWGTSDPAPDELPVVEGAQEAEKVRPTDPGGMEVPYQDSLVLNPANEQSGGGVEQLLPPPEEPQIAEREEQEADGASALEEESAEQNQGSPALEETTEEAPAQEESSAPAAEEVDREQAPTEQDEEAASPAEREPDRDEAQQESDAASRDEPEEQEAAEPEADETASGGGFRLQLASVGERDAAQRAWNGMQENHPGELGDLSLHVEEADLGERGVFYRILAGPLSSRDAAEQLCAELKSQGQDCLVRAP